MFIQSTNKHGLIFFANFCASLNENPKNLDQQNLKMDYLKGTQPIFVKLDLKEMEHSDWFRGRLHNLVECAFSFIPGAAVGRVTAFLIIEAEFLKVLYHAIWYIFKKVNGVFASIKSQK